MTINKKQIQYLKGVAHSLKPIVLLGNNGLTEAVVADEPEEVPPMPPMGGGGGMPGMM